MSAKKTPKIPKTPTAAASSNVDLGRGAAGDVFSDLQPQPDGTVHLTPAEVFCGAVGENAPAARASAAAGLAFFGIGVDRVANEDGAGDRELTAPGSPVRTLVVAAREDLEIARQTREVLTGATPGAALSSRPGPAAPRSPW